MRVKMCVSSKFGRETMLIQPILRSQFAQAIREWKMDEERYRYEEFDEMRSARREESVATSLLSQNIEILISFV